MEFPVIFPTPSTFATCQAPIRKAVDMCHAILQEMTNRDTGGPMAIRYNWFKKKTGSFYGLYINQIYVVFWKSTYNWGSIYYYRYIIYI